jgi:hypothetical protein
LGGKKERKGETFIQLSIWPLRSFTQKYQGTNVVLIHPGHRFLCSTQLLADFHKQVSKILLIDGTSLSEKLLEEGKYSSRIKPTQR